MFCHVWEESVRKGYNERVRLEPQIYNFFLIKQKKENRQLQKHCLQFFGMIFLVKTIPLCRGMVWLPVQQAMIKLQEMAVLNGFNG